MRSGFGLGVGLLLAYGLAQAQLGAEQVLVLGLLSLFLAAVFRFVEDHLVDPLTMKYVARIHPAATILAVLAGGTLGDHRRVGRGAGGHRRGVDA